MTSWRDELWPVCALALGAAMLATAGDLAMLYVANARQPELELPFANPALLLCGYFLGVLAIPLYGVGFWAIARSLNAARLASRVFLVAGVVGAVLGGVIHGVTGIAIAAELRAGAVPEDAFSGLTAFGGFILPLWVVVGLAAVVGSGAYVAAVVRLRSPFPRWAAACNPALLTVVLASGGALSPWLGAFLTPAAPNLAHVVFFGLASLWLRHSAAGGSTRR